jgi:hypothetical protein
MAVRLEPIDHMLLYSLNEASLLIPSNGGGPVHPVTLARWCKSGRVKARRIADNWFIEGRELARVRGDEMAEAR